MILNEKKKDKKWKKIPLTSVLLRTNTSESLSMVWTFTFVMSAWLKRTYAQAVFTNVTYGTYAFVGVEFLLARAVVWTRVRWAVASHFLFTTRCCFVIDSRVHVDLSASDKNPYRYGKREVSVSSYKRVTELDHFRKAHSLCFKTSPDTILLIGKEIILQTKLFSRKRGRKWPNIHTSTITMLTPKAQFQRLLHKQARTNTHARACTHLLAHVHARAHAHTHSHYRSKPNV